MERFNGWYVTGRNTKERSISGVNPSDNIIQDEE
jgi:hypothetical protein